MSSQPPPRKPSDLPLSLRPLKLEQLKTAERKQHSTGMISPSPSSDGTISPLSTDTIAWSPLGSSSERERIMSSDEAIKQNDCLENLQVCSENIGYVTERGQKTSTSKLGERIGSIPGSKLFSSFSLPHLNLAISSASFFKYSSLKGNKGKEKEIENERDAIFLMNDTPRIICYPPGYRGFLETYSDKLEFSVVLRRIFGINTFADATTMELFYPHTINLFLEKKVLVSESAVIRVAGEIKAGANKNLLSSLYRYDRSMSYWLSEYDFAYDSYIKYMKAIFFEEDPTTNIYSVFERIPQYTELSNAIQEIVSEVKYKDIYEDLVNCFKKYAEIFSRERHLDFLKVSVAANKQDIDLLCEKDNSLYKDKLKGINSDLENKIRREERSLLEYNLQLVPEFTRKFKLKHIFFNVFKQFRNEEAIQSSINMDIFPKTLPLWDKSLLCPKGILNICLYFFATLCRRHIKFYDMVSGEKPESICINKKFLFEFNKINKVEEFIFFMQEKRKDYNQGQLKIVLYKTLEYINENTQIDIDCFTVISAALKEANANFEKYVDGPFHSYGEDYFMQAIQIVSDQILKPTAQSSETCEMEIEGFSGPSPKI